MKSIMFSGDNNQPQKITSTSLTMNLVNKPLDNTIKGLNLSVNSLPQLNPFANKTIPPVTKIPFLGNNSTPNTISFSSNPSITYQPSVKQSVSLNKPDTPDIWHTLKTKGWEAFDAGCKSDAKSLEGGMYIISGMAFGAMAMSGLRAAAVLTAGYYGGMINFTEVCIFGGTDGIASLIIGDPKRLEEIKALLPWEVKYLIEIKRRIAETPEYKEISTIIESLKNPPLNGGMMYKKVIYSLPDPHLVKRVEELGAKLLANFANKPIVVQPVVQPQLMQKNQRVKQSMPQWQMEGKFDPNAIFVHTGENNFTPDSPNWGLEWIRYTGAQINNKQVKPWTLKCL